jgi:hypothetical protein
LLIHSSKDLHDELVVLSLLLFFLFPGINKVGRIVAANGAADVIPQTLICVRMAMLANKLIGSPQI